MKREAMLRPPKSSELESMEFRGRTLTEVESGYKEWRSTYRDKYRVTKKHQPKRVDAARSPRRSRLTIPHKYCMLVEFEKLRTKPRA